MPDSFHTDSAPSGVDAALASRLARGVHALGLDLSADQQARLLIYLNELQRWDRVYNLTAIRDLGEMVTRHLLDSLTVMPYLYDGARILDVGTGAGLPGLVLAVANPQHHFTLLDSNGKKTRFLHHVYPMLGLTNVAVVHSRVETYQPDQPFEVVLCRAFASLGDIVALTAPQLASQGRILAMKGGLDPQELATVPAGWQVHVHRLDVPDLDAQRHLLELTPPATKAKKT